MRLLIVLAAIIGTPLTGCADGPAPAPAVGPRLQALSTTNRHTYDHDAFGRRFRVTLYADSPARADEAAAAVRGRLTDLAEKLDAARPEGELARLGRNAGGPWLKVSDELMLLLQQTRRLSKLHDGAADVTAGPVADLWRDAFEAGELPPEGPLDDARALVGWNKVQIDPIERRVRLLLPGMRVDLGQRAAAFAADQALNELTRHGVASAMVDAGDVVALGGPPPGRSGWPVALPPADRKGKPKTVELHDAGVVLLGDRTRVKVIDGRRYADRADPRTGLGVTRGPAAAGGASPIALTVIGAKAFPAGQVAAVAVDLPPAGLALFLRPINGLKVQVRAPLDEYAPGQI